MAHRVAFGGSHRVRPPVSQGGAHSARGGSGRAGRNGAERGLCQAGNKADAVGRAGTQLRPRQDEAEAVRRARDVLLDRRLLRDKTAERVAEPISAGEADRAVVTPRPHREELDLHVELLDPGEVVP